MSAYLVVRATITDMQRFRAYAEAVPRIVEQYGGHYLVLGGEQQALEGDWGRERVVIHTWPDRESALRFWHSDEYGKARKLREGTGSFHVLLADGVAATVL